MLNECVLSVISLIISNVIKAENFTCKLMKEKNCHQSATATAAVAALSTEFSDKYKKGRLFSTCVWKIVIFFFPVYLQLLNAS